MLKRSLLFSVAAAMAATLAVIAAGCSDRADLTPFVSQLRSDILKGESENYIVTCYTETREKPLIPDGKKENVSPAVIIKLKAKNELPEILSGAKATFTTDKEYTALFAFRPESDTYVALLYVGSLPEEDLTVTITTDETQENAELSSVIENGAGLSLKAIDTAAETYKEFFDSEDYKSGAFEINVRVMESDETIYYFVGFVTKDKTEAFLVSADAKNVLARKTLSE